MQRKTQTTTVTGILIALLLSLTACQRSSKLPTAQPGTTIIRSAHSSWIEEQFQTEVVNLGLKQLGYQVEDPKVIDYPAIYVAIANGELEYSTINYETAHTQFFENAGGAQKLERVGTLTPDGIQGYQIDQKTATQYQIKNLGQLKDPDLAKLFDSDGDGKANLVGCNPGWACELTIDHHLEEYGLQDTVEHDKGQYIALLADTLTRYKQAKPVLYFAYMPHWITAVLKPGQDVIWLEVPYTSLPAAQGDITTKETSMAGKNLGFAIERQRIVANKAFLAAHPVVKRWFEQVEISTEDMNAESLRIKEGEDSAADIRRHAQEWVERNQAQFNTWLETAKNANS